MTCRWKGCAAKLGRRNTSGLCAIHWREGDRQRREAERWALFCDVWRRIAIVDGEYQTFVRRIRSGEYCYVEVTRGVRVRTRAYVWSRRNAPVTVDSWLVHRAIADGELVRSGKLAVPRPEPWS